MKNFYIGFILLFFSCDKSEQMVLVQDVGEAQGTFYNIQYLSENGKSYKIQIDSLLKRVDSSVSIYKSYSIISKLNNGEKVQTDDIFNSVYSEAVNIYLTTEGYFDCTVSPLVSYWGFYTNWGQKKY